jgi:hypothetical protein
MSQEVEIAKVMLSRYSSANVAAEMAHWHAMDYKEGDPRREKWLSVHREIRRIAKL